MPKVPARTVIYLELDDEIITIFECIRKARHKKVVMVAPLNALILQSLVNLKILRFKALGVGKELTLVTKDPRGQKLAKEAGLSVLDSIRQLAGSGEAVAPSLQTGRAKLKRRILEIVQPQADPRLKKFAREEIPLGELDPSVFRRFWGWLRNRFQVQAAEQESNHLIVRAPNGQLLFGFILAALILLIFVVYIAVPTATIYITPRADPLNKVVNFSLIGSETVAVGPELAVVHPIRAEFLETTFEVDLGLGATGQVFTGKNATGRLTIFNRSAKDKFIVPSRFLAQNKGIIFRTKKALTIPKAVGDIPGQIVAEVEACERDDLKCDCINEPETCQGDFVGARGNLAAPIFFTLPAIPSLSPSRYWAESFEPLTGGKTQITKFISAEDLENVELNVRREIQYRARDEIQNLLDQKKHLAEGEFTLLDRPEALEVEVLDFRVPPDLLNKRQAEFTVPVKARVRAILYAEEELRALLFGQLKLKVHPEKVLTKVKFATLAFRVEKFDFTGQLVKLVATIEGVEEFDLAEKSAVGQRLTERIRTRILGKNIGEAEKYIRNLPEVNQVVISSWPFWARTVPELPENVKFQLRR